MSTSSLSSKLNQGVVLNRVKSKWFMKYEVILSLIIICLLIISTVGASGSFWNQANVTSLLVNISILGIAAIGATLVIITSGIDISAGSVLGLVCSVVAIGGQNEWPLFLIIIAALITGCIAGSINGYLIAVQKIPPIIVTLGTLGLLRAVVFTMLGGQWGTDIPGQFTDWFITSKIFGIPLCFWIVIVLTVGAAYLMRNRTWGRYIYAIGNNEEATVFSGLPTKRILFFVYTLTGFLIAIAALFSLGQSPIVQSSTGQGFELSVISAVLIGGASITGGRGSIIGGFLGAILVELVKDMIVIFHIPPFWTGVAMGFMIIIAVSLSRIKGGSH